MASGRKSEDPAVKPRIYDFAEDEASILAKYADQSASMELQVHPTHFRFGNQEGIIPRNSPNIQQFLEFVQEGVISPAATEVFRDSGVKFYEGCVILEIKDYRDISPTVKEYESETRSSEMRVPDAAETVKSGASDEIVKPDVDAAPESKKEPPSYRILLRPTNLSLWHDLLYTTDTSQGRFSDQLALSMESEILNLTVRKLDLRVPDNATFKKCLGLDLDLNRVRKTHRVTHPRKPRPIHEHSPQESSAYEEFMLALSDHTGGQTSSTTVSNHFSRLGYIEQLKKKQEALQAAIQAQKRAVQQQQQQQQQQQRQPQAQIPGRVPQRPQGAAPGTMQQGVPMQHAQRPPQQGQQQAMGRLTPQQQAMLRNRQLQQQAQRLQMSGNQGGQRQMTPQQASAMAQNNLIRQMQMMNQGQTPQQYMGRQGQAQQAQQAQSQAQQSQQAQQAQLHAQQQRAQMAQASMARGVPNQRARMMNMPAQGQYGNSQQQQQQQQQQQHLYGMQQQQHPQ